MPDRNDRQNALRQRAEALLLERSRQDLQMPVEDVRALIHDLSVHQIELELQNEELQRAQQETERAKDRYAGLYHRAPVGYITLDEYGVIVKHNQTFAEMTGRYEGRLTGTPLADLLAPDDRGIFRARYRALFKSPAGKQLELRLERSEGMPIWVRISARTAENSVVPPGKTDYPALLVIVDDIDQRRRAEEELRCKNAEIEQFIYTVSHDLRSPLVTIATFLGYLESDLSEGNRERLSQDIGFISGAVDKMKLLLDELLEMSRIGRIEADSVTLSLKEIMAETVSSLAGSISTHSVRVLLPEEDVMLHGDRARLCRIWQNLVENAIKYSATHENTVIDVGWCQEDGDIVFHVRDNGIGIEPDYHHRIFKIFEKLDPSSPGAGLGLSLVQRIVETRGGRIWVESAGLGTGASFRFTLPHAIVTP